jgi:hypothetical protein
MNTASTLWVRLNQLGEVVEASVSRSVGRVYRPDRAVFVEGETKLLPAYVFERIALLKLSPVNKADVVVAVGRRLSERYLTVYLTYDEVCELFNIKYGECDEKDEQ